MLFEFAQAAVKSLLTGNKKSPAGGAIRPLRIAYGRVFHEANAFSPLLTTREDFERFHDMEGESLAKATSVSGSELVGYMPHAELTGFVQSARLAGDVTTVPLSSRLAVPSGPLTPECFEWLVADLVTRIQKCGPLDGLYLALHGSMEVAGLNEAPEAVLLRRVREVLAPDAMIAVSYDLHANLSEGLVAPVDVLIAYRTNPHWDLAPTGFRAGTRLIRALRGEIHPVHVWRKLPMVLGGGVTIDFLAPMRKIFRQMASLEKDPRVISASLFTVHPFTSPDDLGWSVHVSTDGDLALAEKLAEQIADAAWAVRDVAMPKFLPISAALDQAKATPLRRLGPVTIVDADDVVGAGAPGGNTQFVQELLKDDRGLVALVPVHDPSALAELWELPVGAAVRVLLRGTFGYAQPEVWFEGVVAAKHTGDFGKIVRLTHKTLHVAVSERPPVPLHPKFWRELGVEPRSADVIVQKNFFHYRIFYIAISFCHIPATSSGATSFARIINRPYRVPMHPAVAIQDWRASDPLLRRPRNHQAT